MCHDGAMLRCTNNPNQGICNMSRLSNSGLLYILRTVCSALSPLLILLCLLRHNVVAQPAFEVFDTHTKKEYMIPMRDGVKLFTAVYTPKDHENPAPILMVRTPYSCAPYGEDKSPRFVLPNFRRYYVSGYIIVYQDVRGRYMSEGEFENVRPYKPIKHSPVDVDESTDAYDTIEWLIANLQHHNGRVGVTGLSYGGFYASMAAIDAHPALKAVVPTAPVSTWMGGDDFFHNGAFLLPHAFNFFAEFGWPRPKPKREPDRSFDHGTPDEYTFFLGLGPLSNANRKYFHDSVAFWNTLTTNWTWNAFWSERDVIPHLKQLRPAMMYVGGWFDTENLYGALQSYIANEAQSPGAENRLVMGPWSHGQWWDGDGSKLGKIPWGSRTSQFYEDSIEAPFFDHFLKGTEKSPQPEAFVYNTGANVWKRLDSWPPDGLGEMRLYIDAGRRVVFAPPAGKGELFDEYTNDPASPVPYSNAVGRWYSRGFMVEDQRFVTGRNDVLSYTSAALDKDLTIAGPIQVNLEVSTSGTDADWIVKVIDVFPGPAARNGRSEATKAGSNNGDLQGYQMLLRGDVMRGKFRKTLEKPEPMEPGTPTTVRFDMLDVFHTFKAGHRIMIQVQSSWFPMIDRNPGKFLDIFRAKASDYQKTRQRVYRSASRSSYLTVMVWK